MTVFHIKNNEYECNVFTWYLLMLMLFCCYITLYFFFFHFKEVFFSYRKLSDIDYLFNLIILRLFFMYIFSLSGFRVFFLYTWLFLHCKLLFRNLFMFEDKHFWTQGEYVIVAYFFQGFKTIAFIKI